MAPIAVKIKHAGKVHDVQLDPDQPATLFKDAVYQVTGVPPDRMKVMIKGGILKDDTDWRKVGPKAGQTFMVIGAAGELPKPPSTPIQFLEDMDDSALAQALSLPVGLRNLGNTCYMNATLQAMRAIPELQTALQKSALPGLPTALNSLYSDMANTTDSVTPTSFLSALRLAFPQFAEMSRGGASAFKGLGGGYAQQDAEECWVQLTNSLKEVRGLPGSSSGSSAVTGKFVEQYMTGEIRQTLKLKESEAAEEPESVSSEKVLKISCNISLAVNYLQQGIMEALDGEIEKQSPSLGREAVYTSTQRLSRLPSYLTVHMVRFAWKRDIGKKAKIMVGLRRVKFPTEYDALDIVTPELKEKLLPVSRKLKEFEKERAERRKVRKRTKAAQPAKDKEGDVQMDDASSATAVQAPAESSPAPATDGEGESEKGKAVAGAELEEERVYREKEGKELDALVHPDLKKDVGASVTGQYELVAIVTHKGAEADAGHYIGFVKKRALHTSAAAAGPTLDEDDEDWYKFDDDKVSIFPEEKLETLSGGGQDASAYVLLYRTRPLV